VTKGRRTHCHAFDASAQRAGPRQSVLQCMLVPDVALPPVDIRFVVVGEDVPGPAPGAAPMSGAGGGGGLLKLPDWIRASSSRLSCAVVSPAIAALRAIPLWKACILRA